MYLASKSVWPLSCHAVLPAVLSTNSCMGASPLIMRNDVVAALLHNQAAGKYRLEGKTYCAGWRYHAFHVQPRRIKEEEVSKAEH